LDEIEAPSIEKMNIKLRKEKKINTHFLKNRDIKNMVS
jgi:hypothetical protein